MGENQSADLKGEATSFKTCNICRTEWGSRDSFLSDPNIKLVVIRYISRNLLLVFFTLTIRAKVLSLFMPMTSWIYMTALFSPNVRLMEKIAPGIAFISTTWNPALPNVNVHQFGRFSR